MPVQIWCRDDFAACDGDVSHSVQVTSAAGSVAGDVTATVQTDRGVRLQWTPAEPLELGVDYELAVAVDELPWLPRTSFQVAAVAPAGAFEALMWELGAVDVGLDSACCDRGLCGPVCVSLNAERRAYLKSALPRRHPDYVYRLVAGDTEAPPEQWSGSLTRVVFESFGGRVCATAFALRIDDGSIEREVFCTDPDPAESYGPLVVDYADASLDVTYCAQPPAETEAIVAAWCEQNTACETERAEDPRCAEYARICPAPSSGGACALTPSSGVRGHGAVAVAVLLAAFLAVRRSRPGARPRRSGP